MAMLSYKTLEIKISRRIIAGTKHFVADFERGERDVPGDWHGNTCTWHKNMMSHQDIIGGERILMYCRAGRFPNHPLYFKANIDVSGTVAAGVYRDMVEVYVTTLEPQYVASLTLYEFLSDEDAPTTPPLVRLPTPTPVFCRGCNMKNEFGAPNQSDGSYLCFECRG